MAGSPVPLAQCFPPPGSNLRLRQAKVRLAKVVQREAGGRERRQPLAKPVPVRARIRRDPPSSARPQCGECCAGGFDRLRALWAACRAELPC